MRLLRSQFSCLAPSVRPNPSFVKLVLSAGFFLATASTAYSRDVPFATEAVISTAGDGAYVVADADINGDGKLDLVLASQFSNNVIWYSGNGNGTFGASPTLIAGSMTQAHDVVVGDIDRDGDMDVISATASPGLVAWHENTAGDGSAWTQHNISTAGDVDGASSVFVADLNSDGRLDVLCSGVAFLDYEIGYYLYDGIDADKFGAYQSISTAHEYPYSVAAADLDGDSFPDFIAAAEDTYEIVWYKNNGNGTFNPTTRYVAESPTNSPILVSGADIDGDGDQDVLATGTSPRLLGWYENDGTGDFPNFHEIPAAGNAYFDAAAADFDLDGDLDVVATESTGLTAWNENTGGGTFGPQKTLENSGSQPISVIAADFDRDGDLDAVTASNSDDQLSIFNNLTIHRNTTFPEGDTLPDFHEGVIAVHAADIDGDGDQDALAAVPIEDKIILFRNNAGVFGAAETISDDAPGVLSISTADFNRDGKLDVVAAVTGDDSVQWYENTDNFVTAASGGFVSNAPAVAVVFVTTADMNQDGLVDVVYVATGSGPESGVRWYPGSGNGGFDATPVDIDTVPTHPLFAHVADIDGDGDPDVLVASRDDDTIAWCENLSGGNFDPSDPIEITTLADAANTVTAADLDGDGDLDVLATANQGNRSFTYMNDGLGTFSFGQDLATDETQVRSVIAADLDNDGDMDAATSSFSQDRISWFQNNGAGVFGPANEITSDADGSSQIVAADFDGDGDMDILGAARLDDEVNWYFNGGGQARFKTNNTAPANLANSAVDDFLKIAVTHNGLPGETDIELATLELKFTKAGGIALTSGEANAIVENVRFYKDDGSGDFDGGLDTLISTYPSLTLVAGITELPLPDNDPLTLIEQGTPVTFFVVIEATANASSQTPNTLEVWHITEASSTVQQVDNDMELGPEFAFNVQSDTTAVPVALSSFQID